MLQSATFNQTSSCTVLSTSDGCSIFHCSPFAKCHSHTTDGGVSVASLWFDSSLLAIVDDGSQPGSSSCKLKLYNITNNVCICDLLFVTPILDVQMNRRRLIVVLETHIHIYELPYVELLHSIDTALNPRGLCALAAGDSCRIAFPRHGTNDTLPGDDAAAGGDGHGGVVLFDALGLSNVNLINAHKGALASLALDDAGRLLATASVKGTVIRLFTLPKGQLVRAFRRGAYTASIRCLAFAHNLPYLCVASNTTSIHVFKFAAEEEAVPSNRGALRRRSSDDEKLVDDNVSGSPPAPPLLSTYFSSLWQTTTAALEPQRAFALAHLPARVVPACCAFTPVNHISPGMFVIATDGSFFEFALDTKNGGEMRLVREFSALANEDGAMSPMLRNNDMVV
mmetsp:Transcript_17308/g.30149  ORF Transcript_17308/g.30149 Transcript_17308/m.30149 type:complete len:396 (+) Transcript_17308:143-1330(+)